MSQNLLERAHRLYALEDAYLDAFWVRSRPTPPSAPAWRWLRPACWLAGQTSQQTQAVQEARRLLLEMSREAAFKR